MLQPQAACVPAEGMCEVLFRTPGKGRETQETALSCSPARASCWSQTAAGTGDLVCDQGQSSVNGPTAVSESSVGSFVSGTDWASVKPGIHRTGLVPFLSDPTPAHGTPAGQPEPRRRTSLGLGPPAAWCPALPSELPRPQLGKEQRAAVSGAVLPQLCWSQWFGLEMQSETERSQCWRQDRLIRTCWDDGR